MLFLSTPQLGIPQLTIHPDIGIELRLDLLPTIDQTEVRNFLQQPRQSLLTLRKKTHGGQFEESEQKREALIKQLLALTPPFFDLEYDMRPEFLQEVFKEFPETQIILSYHNFEEIPADLDRIYRSMQTYPAFTYKIAATAASTNDALRLLLFSKKHKKVSAICMGENGECTRILGPLVENAVGYTYADTQQQTAPGQLSVKMLTDVYNYPTLNPDTAIYGLIGDPVKNSVGHFYHNAAFQKQGLNAVYVKFAVKPNEICEFLPLIKNFNIRGLSVTSPLKEAIVPFIDEMDASTKHIGAVNTLLFEKGKIIGTNTDGMGALDAVEKRCAVHQKKIVLLGAGGAARSIAFEAKKRGADVLILNRTAARAKKIAADINCEWGELNDFPSDYDVLINCSSDHMSIDKEQILPKTIAMDIVYTPRETEFLQAALSKECQIIYGEEMFLNQAARQIAFWIPSQNS